jgi:multiple sugar transport system permease protein
MFTVILVDIWIFTPFMALIILAGLRSLPKDPLEAAEVDGASSRDIFFKIMAPMILPTVLVAVIFRFIDCVKVFDVIWGMTAGGPGSSTLTLSIQGYVLSFSAMDIAKGNTVLGLIWIINLVLGNKLLDFWRVSRERLGS